jgi:hypothetical protein
MRTTTAKKPATHIRSASKAGATAGKTKAPAKPTTTKKATPVPKEQPAKPVKAKAPKPEAKTLLEALTSGQAVLVKVRANGTIRTLPYLRPKSEVRETAVTVETRRQAGETIEAIAEAMNVSLATVRRYVTGLALAHEVEDGKYDKVWKKGDQQVVVHRVTAKA